jgi:hypothetical protein
MKTTRPDKVSVREWLDRRTHPQQEDPPASLEEIREQLGWRLIPDNGTAQEDSNA